MSLWSGSFAVCAVGNTFISTFRLFLRQVYSNKVKPCRKEDKLGQG